MIIQTEKDLGRWFTNNGYDKGQLIGTDYDPTSKKTTVRLLYNGGVVIESITAFKKFYHETQLHPVKGAICECTNKITGMITVRYSDGEGGFSIDKAGKFNASKQFFSQIKKIKQC